MYRLLALNECQALYEHKTNSPDQPIEPFSYLNDLLSIRSASGFVSFLKNHPQGLKELERAHMIDSEIKLLSLRWFRKSRFNYSEKIMLNAATSNGVDYLDAATDIDGHYDVMGAAQAFSDRAHELMAKYHENPDAGPGFETEFEELYKNAPEADLYRLEFLDLGYLADRIEALLLMAASVRNKTKIKEAFVYRLENLYEINDRKDKVVAVPYEIVLGVLPHGMSPSGFESALVEFKNNIALIPVVQDWDELEYENDDPRPYTEWGLEVKLITVIDDPEIAVRVAINDIVSFALSEWIAHFSSMQGVSNSYREGLTLRESKMNDVVIELANVVIERRVGICPVCGRPFVVKRMPKEDGTLSKKYCTDSCKVRDHGGKEVNNNGKEETA